MDQATTYLHLVLECAFRIGLWSFILWLEGIPPFIRHIDEDELWYYRYPMVDSFFPRLYLYLLITFTPFLLYFLQYMAQKEEKVTVPSIISSVYGLTLAYCITGLFTTTMKIAVGKPRPNFYLRCFPEGIGNDLDTCTGEYIGYMDGRKGFPSSHAAFVFCCMTYLCLHIYCILELKKPRFLKGLIISGMFTLLLIATVVSVSRTMDYHQHYVDIIGGGLIGTSVACVCQHLYSIRDEVLDENLRKIARREK